MINIIIAFFCLFCLSQAKKGPASANPKKTKKLASSNKSDVATAEDDHNKGDAQPLSQQQEEDQSTAPGNYFLIVHKYFDL